MKKTIIISSVILLCLVEFSCSLDFGDLFFWKKIDESKLQNRNGLMYEINKEKPYNGKVVSYYKNGQMKELRTYNNGELNGLSTQWYENGQKKSEQSWKNNMRWEDVSIEWYPNGRKKTEFIIVGDRPKGIRVTIEWYEDGQKQAEYKYEWGKLIGKIEWDEDGQITTKYGTYVSIDEKK